jgi:hypothetical protein
MWRDALTVDGAWTVNPILGGDWNDIVYGNGMFVAVGEGAIMKSADGKTGWMLKTIAPGYGKDIAYDNGYFYIIGNQGMKRSVDCETWEEMNLGVEATWRTISAGGGGLMWWLSAESASDRTTEALHGRSAALPSEAGRSPCTCPASS